MIYSFFLSIFSSLLDSFGILMLFPLLIIASGEESVEDEGSFIYEIYNLYLYRLDFVGVVLFIVFLFLAKGSITLWGNFLIAQLRGELTIELRRGLLSKISNINYEDFMKKGSAYYLSMMVEQVNRVQQNFHVIVQLTAQLTGIIIYLIFALLVAWEFGVLAIAASISILFIFRKLNTKMISLSSEAVVSLQSLTKDTSELFRAFKYLVATQKLDFFNRIIESSIHRAGMNQRRSASAIAFTASVREPIAVSVIMLIIGLQVEYRGQELAPILVSMVLFYRALNAAIAIQANWQGALESISSVNEVLENVNIRSFSKHRPDNLSFPASVPTRSSNTHQSNLYNIKIDNLSFSYSSATRQVFQNINIEVPANTSLALVGKSGSGKSTLLNILCGVLTPSSGNIYINGEEAHRFKHMFPNKIGYVTQESVIFNLSLIKNITFKDEFEMTNEEIERYNWALKITGLDLVVDKFEFGHATVFQEYGMSLSGGQRQRIGLARELFKNPSVLILDEATSALDEDSERSIIKNLMSNTNSMTIVFTTHRNDVASRADKIFTFPS